jgi:hypothetical protein
MRGSSPRMTIVLEREVKEWLKFWDWDARTGR